MAAKVIITPTTVPSRPRNGPPEMAMVSSTMPAFRRCCSRTAAASTRARSASSACGDRAASPAHRHCGAARPVSSCDGGGANALQRRADVIARAGQSRQVAVAELVERRPERPHCARRARAQKARLADHHHPRDGRHHGQQTDDDPAVQRDVLQHHADVRAVPAGGLAGLVLAVTDQTRRGALRERQQAQITRRCAPRARGRTRRPPSPGRPAPAACASGPAPSTRSPASGRRSSRRAAAPARHRRTT